MDEPSQTPYTLSFMDDGQILHYPISQCAMKDGKKSLNTGTEDADVSTVAFHLGIGGPSSKFFGSVKELISFYTSRVMLTKSSVIYSDFPFQILVPVVREGA